MINKAFVTFFFFFLFFSAASQELQKLRIEKLSVVELIDQSKKSIKVQWPLLSCDVNEKPYSFSQNLLEITFTPDESFHPGFKASILFKNKSKDTLRLSNVVPFGKSEQVAYITGLGNHRLSRTHLFLPDRQPVNVIVPDNAWELGYSAMKADDSLNVFGLVRRDANSLVKATRKRFETILSPGGSVQYHYYADFYKGDWQEGLRLAFQKRKLYDVPAFDETLYQREDLKWIRKAYVMHLLMAWDKDFFDIRDGKFHLEEFVERGKKLYGGDDVICIWPTWPTLGIDQRNQFDLYRDLPGGLNAIRSVAENLRKHGVRFFIAYNPWDESTRNEGHLQGLAQLIKATSADGVVLDTKGESSKELQTAADGVKAGVIMYSEGMAVPKDMPGIVSGRVHNALYYPPMLNLNKLIRPDFAIFRVAEVFKEPIQREYATSFFNGYGTEINQFAPGHPGWEEEQYKFFGRTSRILREHSNIFSAGKLTPLISTKRDSVWVNKWEGSGKAIYTIFSLKPEGFEDVLFPLKSKDYVHFIDLWNHEDLQLVEKGERTYAKVRIEGFPLKDLGSNNEGNIGCIGAFTPSLKIKIDGDKFSATCSGNSIIKIWKGNPSYDKEPAWVKNDDAGSFQFSISEKLGRFEGKIVVQAFSEEEVIDEQIAFIKPGTPKLISATTKTSSAANVGNMAKIPAGKFLFKGINGDEFIPYPKENLNHTYEIASFYLDKFPVTNREFKLFLDKSNYQSTDTSNFLKHWKNGAPKKGEENFPVVYVSYEDAQAFARWAGKRLPSEMEWQYAAQTSALNEWPWKQTKPVTRKEQYVTETLTVSALAGIDPVYCNLGDGKLYPVGKYPRGQNPFGLQDLTGCVWQLTNDVYESGSYQYIMVKGGSYFKPSSSWWYVQGGPRELNYRQFLLRVSQGFERNATVGFRCAKD
jgi:iron(II)-dependent oxidoreductase